MKRKAKSATANGPRTVRSRVSAEEWRLRCELAAAHRLIAHFVFVDIYHHFFELAYRAQVGAVAAGAGRITPAP